MGKIDAGSRLADATFEVLARHYERRIRGGIPPGQRAEMSPEGLYLRQRITHSSVVAGIARCVREPDIRLGTRQRGSVAPDHLGRFAGAEYSLECLSLVGFDAEGMHPVEEGLAVGENIS